MRIKNEIWLSGLIFLFVLVATTCGIFYHTTGSPIPYTTVRGERVTFQGSGLYRYDPAWYAQEGLIWDVVNLSIGLPLFALAIYLSQRNSLRGRLLLCGMLFYFVYVYLMYTTGVAFNPLFLVYVAIFGLSAVTFFLNLQHIDAERLPGHISARFPRRLFIGVMFAIAAALTFLWIGRLIPVMVQGRFPADMAGVTTPVSQALDLGMVVPLVLSTAILLWRRSPFGILLAGISLTHGLMMFISIPAWIVVPLVQQGKLSAIGVFPILAIVVSGFVLAGMFFFNLSERESQKELK